MTSNKFIIRTYGKSEYAMMLFPQIDDPKQAQDMLLSGSNATRSSVQRMLVNDVDHRRLEG